MADQPQPSIDEIVHGFLGRIQDLGLPTSDDLRGFVGELKSVRDSIDALSLSTSASVQAQNKLADFYKTGSASDAASLVGRQTGPGSWMPIQSGAGGASVTPDAPIESQESDARRRVANESRRGVKAGRPGGGGPSTPDEDELPQHPPLKMPQYGEFTPQNLLEWMSDSAAHRATVREAKGESGDTYRTAAKGLDKAGQYVARAALIRQFASQHGFETHTNTLDGSGGFQGTGSLVGATNSGGGDLQLPFGLGGFRVPFLDAQFRKGLSEEWQKSKMAMQAGVNKTQANGIFDNLYQLGWLGGDRTNQMRSAGAEIMKYNTTLGNNPATYQAMDKATRMGAASLKDFVTVIKQVPDAAKAAHVSMDQMVQDANAVGEISQQQGGTYMSGFRTASTLSQTTGLPAGMLAQGFENPFVQSYAFRNTGLTPWMQGLQSPYERMQAVFGSINELRGATTFKGRNVDLGGVAGEKGFVQHFDSKDMQAAQLHQLFPEYSPEVLKKMLDKNYQKRVAAGTQIMGAAEAWSEKVGRIDRRHHDTSDLFSKAGGNKGNLGDLRSMMKMAVDSKGKRLFSDKEIAAVMKNSRHTGHWVKGTKGHYEDIQSADGLDLGKKWVKGTKGHRVGATAAQAASHTYTELKKLWDKKMGNPSDPNAPKVTITLSPEARKLFGIKNDQKDKANAGQTSVNIPSAQGPTQVSPFGPGSFGG
jgi:hypothetical protein